jgi:hypothetical protein
MAINVLERLQQWYLEHCDGDWEHQHGASIETLDNPGWRVRVDLRGTPLLVRSWSRTEQHRTTDDWVVTWVEDAQFQIACGPLNLGEGLASFLAWADCGVGDAPAQP